MHTGCRRREGGDALNDLGANRLKNSKAGCGGHYISQASASAQIGKSNPLRVYDCCSRREQKTEMARRWRTHVCAELYFLPQID